MREGDRLNLTCIIKAGLPRPQLSWYKNKILLVHEESTNLILEELTDKDEGQYKCEARNSVGVADALINVTVDSKSGEVLAFVFSCSIFVLLVKVPLFVMGLRRILFTRALFDLQGSKPDIIETEGVRIGQDRIGSWNNYCIHQNITTYLVQT